MQMHRKFSFGPFAPWAMGLLSVVALSASFLKAQQTGPADLVLHNGKVLTVDNKFTIAQAVAIKGNTISAVGSNSDVLKLAGPQTTVIDLKGKTVTPGLMDTHRHTYPSNYDGTLKPDQVLRYPLDWRGVRTKDDVLSQIKGTMDRYKFKPGEWVFFETVGLSFMSEASGDAGAHAKILMDELNRFELDKVTRNNPIVMTKGIPQQNGLLVNGKAIDIIMGSHGDFIKKYGRIWIDAGGRPNGHLEPPATRIVLSMVPHPEPAVAGPQYKKNLEEMNATGLTTFSGQMENGYLKTYQWLDSRGEMTLRLAYGKATDFGTVGGADMTARLKDLAKQMGKGTDKLWMVSASPSNVDGAGSRQCMSLQRKDGQNFGAIDSWYPMGQCNMDSEFTGAAGKTARLQANYYAEWVLEMGRNGVRFANTHVDGDRSHTLLLNLIEQIQKEKGPEGTKGWALDHCSFIQPRDFPRIAKLGVIMSCEPIYILRSAPPGSVAYGEDIANTWVVPVKSLINAGAKVVYEGNGPDYLSSTVWGGLELFINRKDEKGKVWGPQERLDRETALKTATLWAAEYVLKPDKLGSIEPGKWADLLVLDKDYMTIPVEQIHTINPQLTVFDGKIVFLTPTFSQEYNLKPAGAVISTLADLRSRRRGSGGGGGGG